TIQPGCIYPGCTRKAFYSACLPNVPDQPTHCKHYWSRRTVIDVWSPLYEAFGCETYPEDDPQKVGGRRAGGTVTCMPISRKPQLLAPK
ncbi:unnamed protein product, partial [Phaeothamnion confervicola]